jgi:hypothetical protein
MTDSKRPDFHDKFLSLNEVYRGAGTKILRAVAISGEGYLIVPEEDDVWGKDPADYTVCHDWASAVEAMRERDICLQAIPAADLAVDDR